MASQLFCLALLVVSAFGAHDLSYRQQYLPLRNYGIYNQQGGRQGQIPYTNYLLQNTRYSPALVQQQGFEGQVNNPLRQLWWNRQQFLGNTEGFLNSYPEIMDICQRINMPVQGLDQQTIGVNELREINQRLNFLGNTEGLFRSYPEIVEFCQRINMQVQDLAQQIFGVNEIRDANQRLNFLGNTEVLIRSYPEIRGICQRINMPVQGLVQQTLGVNELREINQRLNFFGNTEGLFRSYPEIVDFCQRINILVQGLVHPTTGVFDVNQRWNLPVQGQRVVRPTLEVSEVTVTVPLAQTNTEGSLRYNNVLAPRYQSLYQYQPVSQAYPAQQYQHQHVSQVYPAQQYQPLSQVYPAQQYQPLSQVYPARQNIFSLLGLRPTQQFREQYVQQQLPSYLLNNDYIQRNNFNVENNLVY